MAGGRGGSSDDGAVGGQGGTGYAGGPADASQNGSAGTGGDGSGGGGGGAGGGAGGQGGGSDGGAGGAGGVPGSLDGAAGEDSPGFGGGGGGQGGLNGTVVSTVTTLTNTAALTGGTGGAGGVSDGGAGGGGGGGAGGDGAAVTGNGTAAEALIITNSGAVAGGSGGTGGFSFSQGGDGGDGGAGILLAGSYVTLTASGGSLTGGAGGSGGSAEGGGGSGGAGGAGASFTGSNATLVTSGDAAITGGQGGFFGIAFGVGPRGLGGAGGSGVAFSGANAVLINSGGATIVGGQGDPSVDGGAGAAFAGPNATMTNDASVTGGLGGGTFNGSTEGGSGGAGTAFAGVNASLTNNASITGGAGGETESNADEGSGKAGTGGAGALFTAETATFHNDGTIAGGAGGSSSQAYEEDEGAGGSGDGGDGVSFSSGHATLENIAGSISGGAGGDSGTSATGTGGVGLSFNGIGNILVNDAGATISGGNSGSKQSDNPRDIISPGSGGVGVSGSGLAITNAGTIQGGLANGGAAGAAQADAVDFTGGTNSLTITSTSAITGDVVAQGTASTDTQTFGLGGDASATFDLTQLGDVGSAAQYQGFGILAKTGASTWTVTGTAGTANPLAYDVSAGTLDLGRSTQAANGLTLTGGTLSDGKLTSAADFAVQAGTVSAVLDGDGALSKTTDGVVTLSGQNTYKGATTVQSGTLLVDGSTVSASAVTVAGGATLGGAGTVGGTVDLSGALSASAAGYGTSGGTGPSYGTLTTGALTMRGSSSLVEEIGGTAAGTSYDTVTVQGTATLGGTLILSSVAGSAYGDSFTILTATGGLRGTFANAAANGDTVSADGRTFQVAYADGGGATPGSVTLTDDTITPGAPTIMLPANGADTNSRTVTGTTTAGDAVQVTVTPANGGAATTGAATVTGGTWSYTPATPLADGRYTVTATETAPGDAPSAASAPDTFTLDTTAPTAPSVTDTVAQNAGPTSIGIAAPSDNLTAAGNLVIAAGSLPTDGTVTLADGRTSVTAGEALTAAQLTGLEFTPTPGVAGQGSTFTYSVTDGAGNRSTGAAALNIGAAATNPPAPDAVAFSTQVTDRQGVFTLSGTATSAAGGGSVAISAQVNGTEETLGTAAVAANGTFVFQDALGTDTQGFITANLTDGAGGTASAVASYSLQGGLDMPDPGRAPFVAEQDVYNSDGSATTFTALYRDDGAADQDTSRRTTIQAPGQTFVSDQFDDYKNGGTPETTFVFNPNHGLDTISQFRPDNVDHDTLSFSGADFGNSIANVLNDTVQTKGGTSIIADPVTGDLVKLTGVTKQTLTTYAQQDITFHA